MCDPLPPVDPHAVDDKRYDLRHHVEARESVATRVWKHILWLGLVKKSGGGSVRTLELGAVAMVGQRVSW